MVLCCAHPRVCAMCYAICVSMSMRSSYSVKQPLQIVLVASAACTRSLYKQVYSLLPWLLSTFSVTIENVSCAPSLSAAVSNVCVALPPTVYAPRSSSTGCSICALCSQDSASKRMQQRHSTEADKLSVCQALLQQLVCVRCSDNKLNLSIMVANDAAEYCCCCCQCTCTPTTASSSAYNASATRRSSSSSTRSSS
jgi:hypothetical protein